MANKEVSSFRRIAGGLVLLAFSVVIALYTLGVSAPFILIKMSDDEIQTAGVITEIKEETVGKFPTRVKKYHFPVVTFTDVQNVVHKFNAEQSISVTDLKEYPVGANIPLIYSASHPENVVLNTYPPGHYLILVFGLLVSFWMACRGIKISLGRVKIMQPEEKVSQKEIV